MYNLLEMAIQTSFNNINKELIGMPFEIVIFSLFAYSLTGYLLLMY